MKRATLIENIRIRSNDLNVINIAHHLHYDKNITHTHTNTKNTHTHIYIERERDREGGGVGRAI